MRTDARKASGIDQRESTGDLQGLRDGVESELRVSKSEHYKG